jgi:hypothetical protein
VDRQIAEIDAGKWRPPMSEAAPEPTTVVSAGPNAVSI